MDNRSVNVRNRDDPKSQERGQMVPLEHAVRKFADLRDERRMHSVL